MKSIEITNDMMVLASIIGGFRTLTARNCGVVDAKVGPQQGIEPDQDGILGELAFAQMMNVWPDIGLSPRSGSADATVMGYRCDVKTTRYKNGRLLATTKGNPDVDIYVLAIIEDQRVIFPGYATREELVRPSNLINLGHGKGYALEQKDLRPWKN